jgi:hypothetical protein
LWVVSVIYNTERSVWRLKLLMVAARRQRIVGDYSPENWDWPVFNYPEPVPQRPPLPLLERDKANG